jgi:TnpA family transposase
MGRRVKADVVRERWGEVLRLVASLHAGTVLPSAMLKKLAAHRRQNQLRPEVLRLKEIKCY